MKKTKIDRTGLTLKYSAVERAAILWYLVFHNKTEAFKIVIEGEQREIKSSNHTQNALHWFKQNKIKHLLSVEAERFENNINSIIDNNNSKNLKELKNVNPVSDTDILDKKELIQYISRAIKDNRTDPKTLKDLSANLSKLMQWDKDQEDTSTNINYYELPVKDLE